MAFPSTSVAVRREPVGILSYMALRVRNPRGCGQIAASTGKPCRQPGCDGKQHSAARHDLALSNDDAVAQSISSALGNTTGSEPIPNGSCWLSPSEAVDCWVGGMEHCRDITSEASKAWLNDWEPDFSDEQQQIIEGIGQAAEPHDLDFMLFRGIDLEVDEWEISNFDYMTRVGAEYQFPAPQSYSFERDTAEGFAYLDGECLRPVVFRIEPGTVRAVDRFGRQPGAGWAEGEYVIPAGERFEVVEQSIEAVEDWGMEIRRVKLRAI